MQSMETDEGSATEARIAVSRECRELVRQKKRGGETFDSVLSKMIEAHEREE